MSSTITIYTPQARSLTLKERENWFIEREEVGSYVSQLAGEAAAEEAFCLTNNRNSNLSTELTKFHGPSVYVGDIVRVESAIRVSGDKQVPEYYLCKSFGWEKYDDSVIELIRYFL